MRNTLSALLLSVAMMIGFVSPAAAAPKPAAEAPPEVPTYSRYYGFEEGFGIFPLKVNVTGYTKVIIYYNLSSKTWNVKTNFFQAGLDTSLEWPPNYQGIKITSKLLSRNAAYEGAAALGFSDGTHGTKGTTVFVGDRYHNMKNLPQVCHWARVAVSYSPDFTRFLGCHNVAI